MVSFVPAHPLPQTTFYRFWTSSTFFNPFQPTLHPFQFQVFVSVFFFYFFASLSTIFKGSQPIWQFFCCFVFIIFNIFQPFSLFQFFLNVFYRFQIVVKVLTFFTLFSTVLTRFQPFLTVFVSFPFFFKFSPFFLTVFDHLQPFSTIVKHFQPFSTNFKNCHLFSTFFFRFSTVLHRCYYPQPPRDSVAGLFLSVLKFSSALRNSSSFNNKSVVS